MTVTHRVCNMVIIGSLRLQIQKFVEVPS